MTGKKNKKKSVYVPGSYLAAGCLDNGRLTLHLVLIGVVIFCLHLLKSSANVIGLSRNFACGSWYAQIKIRKFFFTFFLTDICSYITKKN